MNHFSTALAAIQEALAAQGGAPTKWSHKVVIGLAKSVNHAYIRADRLADILSSEELKALTAAGVLVNEGKPKRVRLGPTSALAIGVKMNDLREKAKTAEKEASRVVALERKVQVLARELKAAREANAREDALTTLIEELTRRYADHTPVPFKPARIARPSHGRALAGVPTLFLSDFHWGEVVAGPEVEFFNSYDLRIARRRLRRVVSKSLELLFTHQSGQRYEGMVVPLGGDMLSGNIHKELEVTNELPVLDCIMDLASELSRALATVAENFEQILVPCVVGNHGRIDHKPTAKLKVKNNLDWLLYHIVAAQTQALVAQRNKGHCNVEFKVAEAADVRYDVYNTRYLLTHGDQFRWSGGIGGIFPGLVKTDERKRKRATSFGRPSHSVLIMGHWHALTNLGSIIVNGTLKGLDEYTYTNNFPVNRPEQGLWITHPDLGIIDFRPVFADDAEKPDAGSRPAPISWVVHG